MLLGKESRLRVREALPLLLGGLVGGGSRSDDGTRDRHGLLLLLRYALRLLRSRSGRLWLRNSSLSRLRGQVKETGRLLVVLQTPCLLVSVEPIPDITYNVIFETERTVRNIA